MGGGRNGRVGRLSTGETATVGGRIGGGRRCGFDPPRAWPATVRLNVVALVGMGGKDAVIFDLPKLP
jgi:hypothetical protein